MNITFICVHCIILPLSKQLYLVDKQIYMLYFMLYNYIIK